MFCAMCCIVTVLAPLHSDFMCPISPQLKHLVLLLFQTNIILSSRASFWYGFNVCSWVGGEVLNDVKLCGSFLCDVSFCCLFLLFLYYCKHSQSICSVHNVIQCHIMSHTHLAYLHTLSIIINLLGALWNLCCRYVHSIYYIWRSVLMNR